MVIYRFFVNGFVVADDSIYNLPNGYRGVGFAWPIEGFDKRKLGVEWHPFYPEVATDWEGVLNYLYLCYEQRISVRLFLVKTIYPYPRVNIKEKTKWKFIGYDVACPGGSWHSAVADIMFLSHLEIFREWVLRLNSNGLFNRRKDTFEFLEFYNSLSEEFDAIIERGVDHTVVGLWEYLEDLSSNRLIK